ncbi:MULTISPECIES: nitrogen fixation protein NifQ [unclassified Agarivorans]
MSSANTHLQTPFIGASWLEALSNICKPLSVANRHWFRQIILAQLKGDTALPHGLGLDNASYLELKRAICSGTVDKQERAWLKPVHSLLRKRADTLDELIDLRAKERNELIALLFQYANQDEPFALEMAIVLASASLSASHLWRSLGLKQRSDLSALIKHNFPQLHALNHENMRWKRFFYRSLCEQGGDYICRAPSCGECSSYDECFV